MPKRAPAYMEAQRRAIARAAFECMLEKGVYETSIRDICVRAGVSNGAFYCHFQNRQDAVIAACTLDHEQSEYPRIETWAQFCDLIETLVPLTDEDYWRKRYRLSYQLMAEITQETQARSDIANLYGLASAKIGEIISNLYSRGEIDPPLDIETTQMLCANLVHGSFHALVLNASLNKKRGARDLIEGLALLARPSVQTKRRARRG